MFVKHRLAAVSDLEAAAFLAIQKSGKYLIGRPETGNLGINYGVGVEKVWATPATGGAGAAASGQGPGEASGRATTVFSVL